jgi:hypothetical protein
MPALGNQEESNLLSISNLSVIGFSLLVGIAIATHQNSPKKL